MQPTRRTVLLGAAAFTATAASPAIASDLKLSGPAFGSSWHAVLPNGTDSAMVRLLLAEEIEAVDSAMSPYRRSSELVEFNNFRETGWYPVTPEFAEVATSALSVAELTGGAFDPTVGPAVHRFGFGPIEGGHGDLGAISLRDGNIRKGDTKLTLDFCGIAKGYALDRMAAAVSAVGITDFLIELGGEVATRGRHSDGRDWLVAIERPGSLAAQRIIRLKAMALATSGLAANGNRNLRLGHIIDPATSRPAANGLAAVSVMAPQAKFADAFATAFMVLGPERGPERAESLGISALFLIESDHGFREIMTGGFQNHVEH